MRKTVIAFLRWTEQYTKTDMVYLAKNSGWVFLGQLVTSTAALGTIVALTQLVDKVEYGEYRFLFAAVALLSIFTLPGMQTALVQATATGNTGELTHVVRTRQKWSILASVLASIASGYYILQGNTGLGLSFAIVASCMPFYGVYFSYYFYLQGRELFDKAALAQITTRILLFVALLVTALMAPTTTYLILAFLLTSIIAQYIGYRWTARRYPEIPSSAPETATYGVYLTLCNAAPAVMATQIGVVIVWYFLGAIEAAIYAVAMMLPMECSRLGTILNQVTMPKLAKQTIDVRTLFIKLFKLEIVLVLFWFFYAICAPYIFMYVFPAYPEASSLSVIAMLLILTTPKSILQGLVSMKKMKRAMRATALTSLASQLSLLILLVPQFGIIGAILSLVITRVIECILYIYFVNRQHSTETAELST